MKKLGVAKWRCNGVTFMVEYEVRFKDNVIAINVAAVRDAICGLAGARFSRN